MPPSTAPLPASRRSHCSIAGDVCASWLKELQTNTVGANASGPMAPSVSRVMPLLAATGLPSPE